MALEALAFLPGIILLMLANYTEKVKSLRILTQVFLACLCGLVMLLGALVLSAPAGLAESMEGMDDLAAYGWGMLLSGMAPFVFFLKPVRKLVSRAISIDPDNWLHATSLVLAVILVGSLLGTALAASDIVELSKTMDTSPLAMMLQDALFVIAAFIGVGWLVRRDFGGASRRLGLSKLSLKGFGMSLGFIGLMFAALMVIGIISVLAGHSPDSEDATIKILGKITWVTALLFALGAGIGEELLFRGAMQPRFGMILTAGIFASVHIQYLDLMNMASIFTVGLLLGYERKRLNTTACVITHATYNFIVFLPVILAGA